MVRQYIFQYPQFVWSEEFQVSMLSKHFEAFDILREQKWFIGEYIWNFADFQTAQGISLDNIDIQDSLERN